MSSPLYAIRLTFDYLAPGYTQKEIRYLVGDDFTTYTTNNLEEIKCVFKGLVSHVNFTKEINNCLYICLCYKKNKLLKLL